MKRFHVHVAVANLDDGIHFYSKLFGSEPTVQKPDYAKWMLEDPRVNFAISSRGNLAGVNHLGFQVDSTDELKGMEAQLTAADSALVKECATSCCYARSDKYWVKDPAGIAWETFHTLESIPVYGDAGETETFEAASHDVAPDKLRANTSSAARCAPSNKNESRGCCA